MGVTEGTEERPGKGNPKPEIRNSKGGKYGAVETQLLEGKFEIRNSKSEDRILTSVLSASLWFVRVPDLNCGAGADNRLILTTGVATTRFGPLTR
jgi:hypothetical protein